MSLGNKPAELRRWPNARAPRRICDWKDMPAYDGHTQCPYCHNVLYMRPWGDRTPGVITAFGCGRCFAWFIIRSTE